MIARSTNALGKWVHFGGDVVAGVDYGIGVSLEPGSTGGAAVIQPISDSDTAALTVCAKGAAALTLGNSSNSVAFAGGSFALNSTAVKIGTGSTTAFVLVQKYTVEFTEPDCAATTSVISTYTVTGLTTNSNLVFTPRLPTAPSYVWSARCSTANELCITWTNVAVSSNSGSSNRGILLAFNYV